MTTITREFTKEQLIERAKMMLRAYRGKLKTHPEYDGMAADAELFEIALASLNANPVYQYRERPYSEWMECSERYYQVAKEMNAGFTRILFTASPAPVSVTNEVLNRLEHEANTVTDWHHMDENSCKVNRRDLLTLVNACRAAMLQQGNVKEHEGKQKSCAPLHHQG